MQLIKDLFKKKTIGGICLVVLILFLLVAVFADVIAPTPLGKTGSAQGCARHADRTLHRLDPSRWVQIRWDRIC